MEIFKNGEFSKEFFIFLKYNFLPNDEVELSNTDEKLYEEFSNKICNLKNELKHNSEKSKSTIGSLFSMFGFSRKYCAISGNPIIGKYFKLNGKIVSKEAYEAHQIVEEIEDFDNKIQKKKEVK